MWVWFDEELRTAISTHYDLASDEYNRIQQRRGAYPLKSFNIVPIGVTSEGLEQEEDWSFEGQFASKAQLMTLVRESELKNDVIGELNLANFILSRQPPILQSTLNLIDQIEEYIQAH